MQIILALIGILFFQQAFGQIPSLKINDKKDKYNLTITQLNVDIVVTGNIASTTYDIVFFNPLRRDMEGELSMAMNEGQEISRYALEINGELREGVIVEKIKARQTYEAVVRKNIDPGIINITKGNFFKTKIYPIPARGTKRVVLTISETLTGDDDNLYYSLPLELESEIALFKLDVKVFKSKGDELRIKSDFENIKFDNIGNTYTFNLERENFKTSKPLKFTIPRFTKSNYQFFTYDIEGKTYFYLLTKSPKLNRLAKKSVKNIAIYWDNSFSAEKRDIDKELKLLEVYLKSLKGDKNISLVSFNYKEAPILSFKIKKNTDKLLDYIRNLKNDGASSFEDLRLDDKADEVLIFSDAVNTIGKSKIQTKATPVYAISSNGGSNYSLLKKISSETNGEFINLNILSVKQALEILSYDQEKFLSYTYDDSEIAEVYPNRPTRVSDYFEVTGILKSNKAEFKLNYGSNKGITVSQSFKINKESNAPVSRIWAGKKIEALMYDYDNNKEEILKLSQEHNIVTKNTSFIVLDRVIDYVTHKIVPPEALRADYYKLLSKQENNKSKTPDRLYEENKKRINRLKSWYENPPKVSHVKKRERGNDPFFIDEDVRPVARMLVSRSSSTLSQAQTVIASDDIEREAVAAKESKHSKNSNKPKIKVLAWLPDASYMKILREVKNKDLETVYFELKKQNLNRPAFYIQVSDLMFERELDNEGIRILSNTVELDLENPELLKTVARRFLHIGEYAMAIKIFEEVKTLRPEEPQSYRDLAHAYTFTEQYQEALDLYMHIIENNWGRFEEIKDVVFNEMNNLIALHKSKLNISNVDKGYIKSMPLDVRVVLEWSSNDNDIDLWVIDPNGEKCNYQHKLTAIGGKISHDFTRGYGPEEFVLKNAIRGTYTVYAKYFSESRQKITGPVTLFITLETNYGTEQQETQHITVQLDDNKEVRQVGQFEFGE